MICVPSFTFRFTGAMFNISLHPWQEPAERLQREAEAGRIKLITPQLGELVTIGAAHQSRPWWRW